MWQIVRNSEGNHKCSGIKYRSFLILRKLGEYLVLWIPKFNFWYEFWYEPWIKIIFNSIILVKNEDFELENVNKLQIKYKVPQ